MSDASVKASCLGRGSEIVSGTGCAVGYSCCARRQNIRPTTGCTDIKGELSNVGHHPSISIASPPVNVEDVKLVKKDGLPVGFSLYFKLLLKVHVTYDVACSNCGKRLSVPGLSYTIAQTISIPKSFTGIEKLQKGPHSPIPGVDVDALAQEIFDSYKQTAAYRTKVESVIGPVQGVQKAISCKFKGYLGPSFFKVSKRDLSSISADGVEWTSITAYRTAEALFENDAAKKNVILPEFVPVIEKLKQSKESEIVEIVSDTSLMLPLPAGFCPFKEAWVKGNYPRCLCSTEHVFENDTCTVLAQYAGGDKYLNAICHPITCSTPILTLPVLRIFSLIPFASFDDKTAVDFRQKLLDLLSAQANVSDISMVTIGPWRKKPTVQTYIDVQYRLVDPTKGGPINGGGNGGGNDPTLPNDPINNNPNDPRPNKTAAKDTLQDPIIRGMVVDELPPDFLVSEVQIFATYDAASKSDPYADQFKMVNGKMPGGIIAVIVICILVALFLLAIVGLVIRRRLDPVVTKDSITFVEDSDANPYMYYDNK
jgi:hypothetical protein